MPFRNAVPAAMVATCTLGCPAVEGVSEISVDDLAALLESASPPAVFDVNGSKVRQEYGVIPGATLLTDAGAYDAAMLPADKAKNVVFYCSSSWCSASKTAAKRARDAGHTNVTVLPAGIKGWREAGKTTEPNS
jgi:rhodanese-related sulfurtransferase